MTESEVKEIVSKIARGVSKKLMFNDLSHDPVDGAQWKIGFAYDDPWNEIFVTFDLEQDRITEFNVWCDSEVSSERTKAVKLFERLVESMRALALVMEKWVCDGYDDTYDIARFCKPVFDANGNNYIDLREVKI